MKVQVPRFLTLLLALATIAAFFLPIMKADQKTVATIDAVNEMAEELQIDSKDVIGGVGLQEMKNMSLFSLTKVAFSGEAGGSNDQMAGGIFVSVGVVSVLIALFALCKRPILTLLFDIVGGGLFAFVSYAIEEGFRSSNGFEWGIAHLLYFPLFIAIAVGAIWMFIAKRIDKKAARRRKVQMM